MLGGHIVPEEDPQWVAEEPEAMMKAEVGVETPLVPRLHRVVGTPGGPSQEGKYRTQCRPHFPTPGPAQLSHRPCLCLSEDVASAEGGGEIVKGGLSDVVECSEMEGP